MRGRDPKLKLGENERIFTPHTLSLERVVSNQLPLAALLNERRIVGLYFVSL
jgi:hypothetical protein